MKKTELMNQSDFERLSQLMADKGVKHEAFELLADLRHSERIAKQEANAITDSVVVALEGLADFEGLPVSELNYLQVIRKLKEGVKTSPFNVLEFPIPHKISEVICISCGLRWIAVRPETVKLKELECPCGHGNIIETGEEI